MNRPEPLFPIHAANVKRRQSLRLGNEYERIEIGHEQRVEIEAMTLGIYTHMINRGATLQEVLTAIYLTGFSDALNSTREDNAQ